MCDAVSLIHDDNCPYHGSAYNKCQDNRADRSALCCSVLCCSVRVPMGKSLLFHHRFRCDAQDKKLKDYKVIVC